MTKEMTGGDTWRSPFGAAEDRNGGDTTDQAVVELEWRSPSVAAEDRNSLHNYLPDAHVRFPR